MACIWHNCVEINTFLACFLIIIDRITINAINLWVSSHETNEKVTEIAKKKSSKRISSSTVHLYLI